jgi:tetratricopeptide (TPR) repeat protein
MPKHRTDQLFDLIKSMTKSEKRTFKLYAKRLTSNEGGLFLQLFDMLEKQKEYNEDELFKHSKTIQKSQLSNLKRHLYHQILVALHTVNFRNHVDIQLHQHLDFARILYSKGLFLQSLKMLDRAEKLAQKYFYDEQLLEILSFKKMIESRHITRSRNTKNRMENMLQLAEDQNVIVHNSNLISNLKLKLHGMYIQIGHIRSEKEHFMVHEFFHSNLRRIKTKDLSFFERVHLFQCYVWYYYIIVDFQNCYDYSLKLVNLFDVHPKMREMDPDLLMRGFHYGLTSAFNLRNISLFETMLQQFEVWYDATKSKFYTHSKVISFMYLYTSRLNRHILNGNFEDAVGYIPRIKRRLKRYAAYYDSHRKMVFYFKIAWIYFCLQKYDLTIDYLNVIIHDKETQLREDIQYYSRLLLLIAHYEKGNYGLLEYMVPSVRRFCEKMQVFNEVQREILSFMGKLTRTPIYEQVDLMRKFEDKLVVIEREPYERPAFVYLDFVSWLESKIANKTMSEIIRAKAIE